MLSLAQTGFGVKVIILVCVSPALSNLPIPQSGPWKPCKQTQSPLMQCPLPLQLGTTHMCSRRLQSGPLNPWKQRHRPSTISPWLLHTTGHWSENKCTQHENDWQRASDSDRRRLTKLTWTDSDRLWLTMIGVDKHRLTSADNDNKSRRLTCRGWRRLTVTEVDWQLGRLVSVKEGLMTTMIRICHYGRSSRAFTTVDFL